MRKILALGVAYCTLCRQEANCSSRGKAALEDHVRTAKHKSTLRADLLQRKQSRVPYLASSQQSTKRHTVLEMGLQTDCEQIIMRVKR